MNTWMSPARINQLAATPAYQMKLPDPLVVDPTRPLLPESYTQLYYTPVYASLHREHRLRYNQLFGLRMNEYIMMLEAELINRILVPIAHHPKLRADAELQIALSTMIAEERHHYNCFLAINRCCRPDLYPPPLERLFSVVPAWANAMFWSATRLVNTLAFSLWYQMAMEESSMALARDMQKQPATETLGDLDPVFCALHIEHMKDEARHVQLDGLLVDLCINEASPRVRRLNAQLFKFMLRGITRPTRSGSGVKVIRQLVKDMPELKDREEEMIRAVLALVDNEAYQKSLFNRRIMPVTFRLFDQCPELSGLGRRMRGYDRR
jgi:hypothetical protein